MRIYFRIFYLIVALLFLSINLYAKDFLASVKDIRTEISRDNIDEALKILGSLNINNETDQEQVDLLFGDIYLKINQPQKAIEFYEKTFITSDTKTESLSELGLSESYLRQGKLNEAIDHAKRSLELDEDNIRTRITLSIALTRNGEKEEALKILNLLYQSNQNSSEVNLAIAGYHSTFENNKEAINVLDKYLKKFPTDIRAMDEIANLYWIDGNKDKALELKYKVYKYYEFNRNRTKLKEIKNWIL